VLFNLYLEHIIIEWQDSNLLKTDILTTLLFADDKVIIISSQDSVQKLLHKLSKTAITYTLTISTLKMELFALKGKELVKTKLIINNIIKEQLRNFNKHRQKYINAIPY
jgi:hypothetical protein